MNIDNNNDRRVFGTLLTDNDANIRSSNKQESYKLSSSSKTTLSPVKKFLQSSSSLSIIEKHDNLNLSSSSSPSPMRILPLHNHHTIESSKVQQPSKVQQLSSSSSSSSSSPSPQYSITFPPGPMGLELEPVIISSEREIGCRVKDYYFGVDHDGINEDYVLKNIAIGDIISCISGQVVLSSKFTDILDILRSLRGTSRTIFFKNISASWNLSNKSESNYVFSSNKLTKPIITSSLLPDRNQLKPTLSTSPLIRSPLFNQNNISYDREGDISISFAKDHHTISNLLVSPKAVREISKSSNSSAAQSPVPRSIVHNLEDSTVIPIISVDLKRVLGTIGSSIGASILTIGNALGNVIGEHAERVVVNTAEKIPRYNINEMDQVVMKKQKLLNELSQSCFLLGAAEESKQSLLSQVEDLKSKELDLSSKLTSALEKLDLFQNENIILKSERSDMLLSLQNTQSELASVKFEFNVITESQEKMSSELMELNKNASIQQQNLLDITEDLNMKENALQKALSDLEGEVNARNAEQRRWQEDMKRMLVEKQNLRHELGATFDKVKFQLEEAENARDTALVELEVLRDTAKSDRDAFEVDLHRMRENLRLQQEQYKEQLLEKEGDIYAQRKEISDFKLELIELKKFKIDAEAFRVEMSNKVTDAICEVAAKDQQLRELELKIQNETPKKKKMNEDIDCLRENLLSLADRSAQLENHVQLLEQKNGILEGEIDALNYIITECKEENLKLIAIVDKMESKANASAADLELSREKFSNLEEKNQLNIESSKQLTIEKSNLEQQIVILTNQLELITMQWKEQLEISSVFENKLQDCQDCISRLKDSKTNLLKEINDEQLKYKELEDEHEAYKNHMGVLERRLEERNVSIVELNSKLDDACQQNHEFVNHLEILMKEKNTSDIDLQSLMKERDMYKTEAVSSKEILQAANAKHCLIEVDFLKAISMAEETHDGIKKDLEIQITKLEIDRDTYKNLAEQHAREIDRLTAYNNDTQAFVEHELSKAKSDLLEASKTMDDMKLTLSKQEQMIKIEIDKNNELNKSLDALKEQLAIQNEKLATSSESYDLAVTSKIQIESDIKELHKKINLLEVEKDDILNNCSKKCLWFFECTGNLRTDLAEARIDIANLIDLNNQMSKVAIDSLAKTSNKVNDLSNKIKNLTNQNEETKLKLQIAENNANDAHERYNHSISKIFDIEKSKDGAINEIASLHKQLNDSLQASLKIQEKLQISELKSLTIIEDFNNETSKLKDHYEQRIKSLEDNVTSLECSLTIKEKQYDEIQMLKKIDNDNYVKETSSYKEHMSVLTKQLVELKIKNEDLELRLTEASSVINEQLELLKVAEDAYNNKQRELITIQQTNKEAQDSTTHSNHHQQQLIVDLEHSILSYKEDIINKDSTIHNITEKYNKLIADLEQSKNIEGILRTQITDQDAIIKNIKKENDSKFDSLVQQSDDILKSNMKEIESLKCLMQEAAKVNNNNNDVMILKDQLNDSKQSNTYLKTQLDDILIALDAQALALKEAEIREYEHNSTIKYLERLVLEAGIVAKNNNNNNKNTSVNVTNEENNEYTLRLLNQIKEVQSNLTQLHHDYTKKCEDYDNLNGQVIQLLRSSYTPMKPPNTDVIKNDNPKGDALFNNDVDYKIIQTSNCQRVPLGDITQPSNSNNDYDEISIDNEDKDDIIITLVLQLHDLIGSAVMFVANSPQEDSTDLKSKLLSKWYLVSDKVQELYQTLLNSNEGNSNVPTLPSLHQAVSSMIMDNETSTYDDSNIDDSLEGAFANNENLSPIIEVAKTTRCRCPVGQQLDQQDQNKFHVINDGDKHEMNICIRNSFQSIASCSVDNSNSNNNVYNRHSNIEDDDTVRLSSNFFVENEISGNIDGDSQPEGEESFWNVSTSTETSIISLL